jgi:hypothetical protein
MRLPEAVCVCLCVGLVARATPLQARQTGEAAEAQAFRQQLLDALARGDRRSVAGMVRYRLVVDAGGLMIPIADRATLIRLWDVVFPPEVRCLIEESGVPRVGQPAPKYAIRVDAGGVSWGDGRIRIDRGADGLKIARMALPPGYGSGLAGKPRQVIFKWGTGRVTYTGRLSADNVDVYLVNARKGELLNAQLERARVEDASVRVVQQLGNRVLPAPGSTAREGRLWAGPVPETGEYRVEVLRRGAYCDPPVKYQLKVSLE